MHELHNTSKVMIKRNEALYPRFPKALITLINGRGDRLFGHLQ